LFFIAAIVFSTLRIFIKSPQMVFQPTIAQAFPSSQIPIINWTPTFAPKSTTQIPILMISPTNTLTPTNSILPTASRITIPVVGGADKIAYLNGNDILVANLDGNEMVKLTDDGAQKSDLRWVPGGQGLTYVQGKCVQYVELESGRIDNITCFNFVDYLRSFAISPDNQLAAISLDNQLYIVPYDVSKLNKVQTRGGLTSIADCKDFAPFETNYVKTLNWSKDGKELAAVVIGVSGTGFRADIIRVFDVSTCTPTPQVLDHFPTAARLQMKDYDKNPEIQNFGWDGLYLFALNTSFRNDGFGDIYVYNMDLHKGTQALNPINNSCCYRDPHWSPDGSYLLFAYQNMLKGPQSITELYYIQFGTLGTGLIYDPLPLSPINDPRGKPIPVLRPAP
jgi:Tol biopolymer transport system component